MAEKIALFNTGNNDYPWQNLAKDTINNCPKIKKEREKEILAARFGIGQKTQTLQAIGDKYGITRERVRQIINNTLSKIKKHCVSREVQNACSVLTAKVAENGGYISSDGLSEQFGDGTRSGRDALLFIANLSDSLENVKVSDDIRDGWRLKKIKTTELKKLANEAVKILKEKGDTLTTDELSNILKAKTQLVRASLTASKKIMADDSDKWGLVKWPHVNPRSIRDKSKYIMVRHGKPMHYGLLAEKISEIGAREVTKQSVHNELIKNEDFVLVGRGIYALSQWGYAPGIVEDVIVAVLSEAGEPLAKEIIVERVLERRIVKPSTIVLNLQRPKFKKVGKAVYTLN